MITRLPEGRPFLKMHGLGNDFVLLDGRIDAPRLSSEMIQALADRRTGIGFDQLITLLPAPAGQADAFMSIHNADGSQVAACGNASRCVAWLLMQESSRDHITLATRAGLLSAWGAADGQITVDMGPARLDWQDIPLAQASDTLHLPLTAGPLRDGVAVSMGNPHAVFFVADAEAIDLSRWGPLLETDPLFPQRCNIEVAQVMGADRLRMRVWERGTGITQACGTGACATLVAAARLGLCGRQAEVIVDGGRLGIEWRPDNHVLMTGPVALSFAGRLNPSFG